MFTHVAESTDTFSLSFQGVCDEFQKQDTCGVPWESGVGEISCDVGTNPCPASGNLNISSSPRRRLQLVRDPFGPTFHVGFKFSRHHVWYVAALVSAFEC